MRDMARVLATGLIAALPLTTPAMAQPAASSNVASSERTVLVGSDALVGSTVRDATGVDVGKVSRLMIDPSDGHIVSVVVAAGGKFGIGGNTISVPWNTIKVSQDNGRVIVVASQTLDPAPKTDPPPRR
ncbi:MAG TPA: PRC-barrel domain-containing protein [Candidatus Methylomirabilis sp.]|nr:PRC-barrel domain-containing protein [Candidatus Methylomirabilis sp.]